MTVHMRDGVVKVRWEMVWFEEGEERYDVLETKSTGGDETKGQWFLTMARYFIRLANRLLVEEVNLAENQNKWFVMLTADVNSVKLV